MDVKEAMRPIKRAMVEMSLAEGLIVEVVWATADTAEAYLATMVRNRKLKRKTAEKYTRIMLRDEWMLNGETIVFNRDGEMCQGQHRCHALIEADKIKPGIKVPWLVVRGVDPKAFLSHDNVARRTTGDVLHIRGELCTAVLGAILRNIAIIDNDGASVEDLSPGEIGDVIEKHPRARYWSREMSGNTAVRRILPSSLGAVLTLGDELHSAKLAQEFFYQLASGAGLAQHNPALMLRNKFINTKHSAKRLQPAAELYLIAVAWNAHVEGKPLKQLQWSDRFAFPGVK